MQEKNNKLFISGEIATRAVFSHEVCGEHFYEMFVATKRLSGILDVIPVTISERLMTGRDFKAGEQISLKGQLRSHNKLINGKSKLILSVFVEEIISDTLQIKNHDNKITLTGYVCKTPEYRVTPLNREITDILIAVNRAYNKSDYIPCLAWGRNARFVKELKVGDKITIEGRFQSREYQKCIIGDIMQTCTAYEVSISNIYVGGRENE